MRVLLAGAGIAGLTLDADGGNRLEARLPADLYERHVLASHGTPSRADVAVVIDSQCHELTTAPHIGPPNDGEMRVGQEVPA